MIEAKDAIQNAKDSVIFEMKNKPPQITFISPLNGQIYEKNINLEYTITDADYQSAIYSINNGLKRSINQNRTIPLFLPNGINKIVVEAKDAEQTVKDSVTFEMKRAVGIEDSTPEERFIYYPNPAESILHIKYKSGLSRNSYRIIYSSEGKPLERKTIGNISQEDLDISHYNSGMYILQIVDGTGIQEYKFIKK